MNTVGPNDPSGLSMLELFHAETETQKAVLTSGLLALEQNPAATPVLEDLMRAAHSLKGAARLIGLDAAVRVAHGVEDCFQAAQKGKTMLQQVDIDALLSGVDLLCRIAQISEEELPTGGSHYAPEVEKFLDRIGPLRTGTRSTAAPSSQHPQAAPVTIAITEVVGEHVATTAPRAESASPMPARAGKDGQQRFLRVTAENLNRLLALTDESMVASRRLRPFADSLVRLKRHQAELTDSLDLLRDALSQYSVDERTRTILVQSQRRILESRQYLSDRLSDLDMFDRRLANLSHRLYGEALTCRMRPFADGIHGFPRMVRDVARALGKKVRIEVVGESTQVDRDILEKLEAPLTHLLRNAVDHGIEAPEDRRRKGKPEEGIIWLEARHSAGMLMISVTDDGRGAAFDQLREAVVRKRFTNDETAAKLSDAELLEFLFLPGFSTKEAVTEVSGRGVGLDVVQEMIKNVRGVVRISTPPGYGLRFQLQLPLTLSVVRTLLVEIADEPYAFPLAYLSRTLKLDQSAIQTVEGRQHFDMDGQQVGLVTARQIFGKLGRPVAPADKLLIVVVGQPAHGFGVVVDRFLGERELVVQALDPRLGGVRDISAGSLMEDGSPVLIIDVERMIQSVEKLAAKGLLGHVQRSELNALPSHRKRILVVDDSLTVRELERKLLHGRGYHVETAVDGMDGWNAVRSGEYDLVVTDIDMPRLDGIGLVSLIKGDPDFQSTPTLIVSYKDRPEDRQRALDAGADFYLPKGSFHDDTFVKAVIDLIGEAEA